MANYGRVSVSNVLREKYNNLNNEEKEKALIYATSIFNGYKKVTNIAEVEKKITDKRAIYRGEIRDVFSIVFGLKELDQGTKTDDSSFSIYFEKSPYNDILFFKRENYLSDLDKLRYAMEIRLQDTRRLLKLYNSYADFFGFNNIDKRTINSLINHKDGNIEITNEMKLIFGLYLNIGEFVEFSNLYEEIEKKKINTAVSKVMKKYMNNCQPLNKEEKCSVYETLGLKYHEKNNILTKLRFKGTSECINCKWRDRNSFCPVPEGLCMKRAAKQKYYGTFEKGI